MLDFMVIGLPRCGTTWAANWLTTDRAHCVHDPLNEAHFADWERLDGGGKLLGVSCTAIWHWPEWVNAQPARKLILHRPLDEVRASLARLDIPGPPSWAPAALDAVRGLHMPWTALFEPELAAAAWAHLTGLPFDQSRHAALRDMIIQPAFANLKPDAAATRRISADVRAIIQKRGL